VAVKRFGEVPANLLVLFSGYFFTESVNGSCSFSFIVSKCAALSSFDFLQWNLGFYESDFKVEFFEGIGLFFS
jgi:hypothetical protein